LGSERLALGAPRFEGSDASSVNAVTFRREHCVPMLAPQMGESDRHTQQTEAASPASSPALAASRRRSRPRMSCTTRPKCTSTKLEHRPSPPERGLRRFCNTGTERARERGLLQQMCRGLIHDRDASWRSQSYPLRAPRSEGGTAAVGSRRASTCERAGRREEWAPGTNRGPETVGLTDQRGGCGHVSRAALSDRRGDGRTPARSGLRSPGRPPVLPGGRPGVVQANANRGGWR